MIQDADRFQKIASGIQSILFSCAIVVGGWWTLHTFTSQLQVENARAQLAKLQHEIEAEPKVELSIALKQLAGRESTPRYLVGEISIKNVGNKTTVLQLDRAPVHLFKVVFDDTGKGEWTLTRRLEIQTVGGGRLESMSSHAGATNATAFATTIPEPGLYAVSFSAARNPAEVAAVIATGGSEQTRKFWATEQYFVVK